MREDDKAQYGIVPIKYEQKRIHQWYTDRDIETNLSGRT